MTRELYTEIRRRYLDGGHACIDAKSCYEQLKAMQTELFVWSLQYPQQNEVIALHLSVYPPPRSEMKLTISYFDCIDKRHESTARTCTSQTRRSSS